MNIVRSGSNYLMTRNDGHPVVLSCSEAGELIRFIGKENLRTQIDDRVLDAEGDWLDLSRYEGTRDDFIWEIYDGLEEEIDNGNSVSEDKIDDSIADLGRFYGLEKEE